jgi:predicted KAP-like P-loop ATPase
VEEWNGKKDLLNRKKEAKFLTNYLLKRYENNPKKPFVLNVNAEWGFGKTFFLENLAEDLKNKDYPVLYFDAWQNDYTNEPLISFISEMDSLLTPYFNKDESMKKSFKNVIKSSKNLIIPIILKKLTGHGLDELEELVEDEPNSSEENKELKDGITTVVSKAATLALTEHQTIKSSIVDFKKNMGVLIKAISAKDGINLPMFIFIDELDRCRPNYAIELLENIKHIFDIPGITFVIATDSEQLSHSINAIYGNNFASERYLK